MLVSTWYKKNTAKLRDASFNKAIWLNLTRKDAIRGVSARFPVFLCALPGAFLFL
jgi:hypothetical protein